MTDTTLVSLSEEDREAATPRTPGSPMGAESIPKKARRFSPPLTTLMAVAVVAALVAGGLLWERHTRSPQYSLRQMAAAARSGDWEGVQRYMDVDAVASHFVDAAFSGLRGAGDTTDRGSSSGGGMGRSAGPGASSGSTMKDTFMKQFHDALKAGVEDTAKTGAESGPSPLLALKPKSVAYVNEAEALVTAEVAVEAGETQEVTVRMNRVDGHWRISALEDVADLLGLLN